MHHHQDHRENASLFRQLERGSKRAFSEFYDRYVDLVFRVALNTVQDPLEAEDVCHDVFLEVYQKPDSYDPERGSVEAWLTVKTRSRCLDHLRKKRPICIDDWDNLTGEKELAPSAEVLAMKRAEQKAIHDAMRHIPLEQQQVLYHTYFKERTHRTLSEEMQRPLGTIKSRIRYGLQNLKKQLTLHGWGYPSRGGEHK